jgi:peptidyl-prolyl cis-trans isomerase A (cyclophilin A)
MQKFSRLVLVSSTLTTALFFTSVNAWAQKVILTTNLGDIEVQLNAKAAPKTVDNFIKYVKDGHYNGTVFHRVIENFMIQGGGMTADMREKPNRAPIPLESKNGLENARGTLAMARTGEPNSATSQFFINVKDNAFLNASQSPDGFGYAVFGKVTAGMDIVDKIRSVPTGNKSPHANVPLQPITIVKAIVKE